jgi:nucleoside-diphosphate kinase
VPLVLQKTDAVTEFRKAIGATDPEEAGEGTIRRLYGESKERNTIHGSDSNENARIEIEFFFPGFFASI